MELERNSDGQQPESPDWDYIDSHSFREKFTAPKKPNTMRFYVEGVGCSKCLAKIENLKRSYSQVVEASMDMSKNILRLEVTPKGRFAPFISGLEKLGYKAHPISEGQDQSAMQARENRRMLRRIGIAAFCTGNIMLFAVSSYGGLTGAIEEYFNWLSMLLALPVMLYSAQPFYQNLWTALKASRPSIDMPIVLALLIGFGLSAMNTIRGTGDVYFDTLTTLVFLLLSARYFLKRIQQSYLSSSFFLPFLNQDKVRVWSPDQDKYYLTPLETVKEGDFLLVKKGEKVPADGKVESQDTKSPIYINNAFLTGESLPVQVKNNEAVFAGAELTSDELRLKVTATGEKTRLGSLFEKMEEEVLRRTPLLSLTDKLAQWFTFITVTTGGIFFIVYSAYDVTEATRRALALVILACPCALALATPLTQSLSLLKAARQGYVIKTAEVLEKLKGVSKVVFDKTGTLTEGQFKWLTWLVREPNDLEKSLLYALEESSQHPVAKALLSSVKLSQNDSLSIDQWQEVHGRGVSARYLGDHYEVRGLSEVEFDNNHTGSTQVGFYKNGDLQFAAALGDQLRSDSPRLIHKLQKLSVETHILSGDAESPVAKAAESVGIAANMAHSKMTPESKLEWIKSQRGTLIMVGDGANDAAALAASPISVAVQGSMEVSLHAADIYLSRPGVLPIFKLIRLGQDTMKVIYRNLSFSLLYNLIGGIAALMGYVNPLVAAILMPISSLCVLLSSLWGTKFLRSLNKAPEAQS